MFFSRKPITKSKRLSTNAVSVNWRNSKQTKDDKNSFNRKPNLNWKSKTYKRPSKRITMPKKLIRNKWRNQKERLRLKKKHSLRLHLNTMKRRQAREISRQGSSFLPTPSFCLNTGFNLVQSCVFSFGAEYFIFSNPLAVLQMILIGNFPLKLMRIYYTRTTRHLVL